MYWCSTPQILLQPRQRGFSFYLNYWNNSRAYKIIFFLQRDNLAAPRRRKPTHPPSTVCAVQQNLPWLWHLICSYPKSKISSKRARVLLQNCVTETTLNAPTERFSPLLQEHSLDEWFLQRGTISSLPARDPLPSLSGAHQILACYPLNLCPQLHHSHTLHGEQS